MLLRVLFFLIAGVSLFWVPTESSIAEDSVDDGGDRNSWLHYTGADGPGQGKHVVLIAAEQEYRSEESMPMLARVLASHHGFDCTVLFSVNEKGEVDPTLPA
ncbi:MAG: hypothetical protein VYE67_16700, partial [Planctomycetota bacterium]|nr:hypothetical protein [Planctomycetota bacterium]